MTPSWVGDTVFYQIFPDRFARSEQVPKSAGLQTWGATPTTHGYQGGDLLGIVEHLDHLTDLGIGGIYLTPIFQSASNHRYHTHDYFTVDPMLGGDAAFATFLAACRERSLRVVLDGVFNHVGRGFFAFNDVVENGAESPWRHYFHVHGFPLNAYQGKPNFECWRGIPALPKLNTEDPAVREMLWQVAEHWARQGIDGWRLDVPEDIRTPGFWEELRARVKRVREDFYLVGEIWSDASAWLPARFDGTMGYWLGGHTLVYAAQENMRFELTTSEYPLVQQRIDAQAYGDHVTQVMARYPDEVARCNLALLGSHDTARLRSMVGDDYASLELATLLTFTTPGAPCIYYGDEIGMRGGRDPDCRRAFDWDRSHWDARIHEHHRALVRLRREHVALRRGRWRRLARDTRIHAFAQEHPDEVLWIAANATSEGAELVLHEQIAGAELLFGAGSLEPRGDGSVLQLGPRSGAVWRPLRIA